MIVSGSIAVATLLGLTAGLAILAVPIILGLGFFAYSLSGVVAGAVAGAVAGGSR